MRAHIRLLLLLLASALPVTAFASRTVVPDDHATIQAAVDSGVDTVVVRPGDYPEVVTVDRSVVVMAMIPDPYPAFRNDSVLPIINGFIATGPSGSQEIELHSMRVLGTAQVTGAHYSSRITGCRFDAGLTVGNSSQSYDYVFNCLVFGDLTHRGHKGEIGLNSVVGGTISFPNSISWLMIHDNVVIGTSPVGIRGHQDAFIRNNYVRGCDIGIQAACHDIADITGKHCRGLEEPRDLV